MKFVINAILLLMALPVMAGSLYEDILRKAALQNGFADFFEVNQSFDPLKSALGREFFHEQRFSFNDKMSCGTCHLDQFSSTDGLPNAIGVGGEGEGLSRANSDGEIVPRNVLPLWGRGGKNFTTFFWDGKVTEVDGEIVSQLGVITKGYVSEDGQYRINQTPSYDPLITAIHLPFVEIREMVMDDEQVSSLLKTESPDSAMVLYDILVARLKLIPEYVQGITSAYGISEDEIAFQHIVEPIAHFIRDKFALQETAFSRFIFNDDVLSEESVRGGLIFYGKGKCSSCHSGPYFSDLQFYSVPFPQAGFGKNGFGVDYGRYNITFDVGDLYKFRTPPLINVAETFPYSHSGSVYDLKDAIVFHFDPLRNFMSEEMAVLDRVEFYKRLRASGPDLTKIPFLDDEEVMQLEAFLNTLSFWQKD